MTTNLLLGSPLPARPGSACTRVVASAGRTPLTYSFIVDDVARLAPRGRAKSDRRVARVHERERGERGNYSVR